MARKRKRSPWKLRLAAALALLAAAVGGYLWWQVNHWLPPEESYPDQGVVAGARDGVINFRTVRALGGSFAYLDASDGESGQDARFSRNFAAGLEANLQVGAVHAFDPCAMADGQSANFVTMVPRDSTLLPPAIELRKTADACEQRVSDAAVESELMTLINQIENHSGKAAILKIDPEFEARYGLASQFERNLWLTRTWIEPDYAGRPWLLWTANEALRSEASEDPVRWVVVQP
ncbi:glycoside hydrolase family 25 protein [Allopontixanthobacter sp.]|uniref:glycoside hydrolase family 25 protein n=1 Tax=Allopontixanthobacter sp. TaxID=2906452 RepID=UPI002AB861BA|nr:glycoside hydrolase family 25 protein [Allopontixanthobacter sp.]MDZ4306898.1 glycoside hydrolase family 25 protein [Allopontixanthobacter sp.]